MIPAEKKSIDFRIRIVGGFFFLLLAGIFSRAFYLQVLQGDQLSRRAATEYEETRTDQGRRGMIYDIREREMAVSSDAISIAASPRRMSDSGTVAVMLAGALGIDEDSLRKRLASKSAFTWIKRQVSPKEEKRVRDIVRDNKIDGMEFVSERSRYYPGSTLAGQVIGFTGTDGHGLEGIEYYYDSFLKGAERKFTVFRDARQKRFDPGEQYDTVEYDGRNVVLTIDKNIQFIAEKVLAEAVAEFSAASGMAIVMDPRTGAVMAMANVPLFNPNIFKESRQTDWRNRNITDPFEPGSTMKIFTAAGAIEFGGCTPNTIFFCENGKYRIGRDVIHDTHSFGWLSIQKIIKHSSNIGAIKISEMIGAETLDKTLRNFGFGEKTGIDCPGETTGLLSPGNKWSAVDTGSIAFGYGLSVSAIQLVTAVAAIANKGVLMKPYIVKTITDPTGRVEKQFGPQKVRQAVSEKTARTVMEMMQTVVESGGTGTNAALEGYSVCGKTGTAKKVSAAGGYTEKDYLASFVGIAPVEDPRIVVLVVIDEPQRDYYGGLVAGPAFKKIAQETLNYISIPSRITQKKAVTRKPAIRPE